MLLRLEVNLQLENFQAMDVQQFALGTVFEIVKRISRCEQRESIPGHILTEIHYEDRQLLSQTMPAVFLDAADLFQKQEAAKETEDGREAICVTRTAENETYLLASSWARFSTLE